MAGGFSQPVVKPQRLDGLYGLMMVNDGLLLMVNDGTGCKGEIG